MHVVADVVGGGDKITCPDDDDASLEAEEWR
jgi:hypothetical protein